MKALAAAGLLALIVAAPVASAIAAGSTLLDVRRTRVVDLEDPLDDQIAAGFTATKSRNLAHCRGMVWFRVLNNVEETSFAAAQCAELAKADETLSPILPEEERPGTPVGVNSGFGSCGETPAAWADVWVADVEAPVNEPSDCARVGVNTGTTAPGLGATVPSGAIETLVEGSSVNVATGSIKTASPSLAPSGVNIPAPGAGAFRDGENTAPGETPSTGAGFEENPAARNGARKLSASNSRALARGGPAGGVLSAGGELALGIIATIAIGALLISTLYSRFSPAAHDHPARLRIYEILKARPGLTCQEIAREIGLGLVNTRYHLRRLEAVEMVKARRVRRRLRYYVPGTDVNLLAAEVTASDVAKRIVTTAASAPAGLTLAEISRSANVAPSLCHYHLKKLVDARVLASEGVGRQRVYHSAAEQDANRTGS